jgi:hypothetical protein
VHKNGGLDIGVALNNQGKKSRPLLINNKIGNFLPFSALGEGGAAKKRCFCYLSQT